MKRISDEKIKAIATEYLTNGMIKTKALKKVGYSKNYAEHGGLKLFDNDRLKKEMNRIQSKIELKTEITVVSIQQDLIRLREVAEKDGNINAAVRCTELLGKTIGGFQAEKQPIENLVCKAMDARKAEELNKAINAYYANKYLAVESTEIKQDISVFPISSLPDCNNLTPENEPVDLASPVQQNAQSIP
jgi:phage terminase small subunit